MKNQRFMSKIMILLALITLTDNLSAGNWYPPYSWMPTNRETVTNWIPNRPQWTNQLTQTLSSQWANLSPYQQRVALGALLLGLGGGLTYKGYNWYQEQQRLAAEQQQRLAAEQQQRFAAESAEANALKNFLDNLDSYNTQISLLDRKNINANDSYPYDYNFILKRIPTWQNILEELQKNKNFTSLSDQNKEKAKDAIDTLKKRLDNLQEDVNQRILAEERKKQEERARKELEKQRLAEERKKREDEKVRKEQERARRKEEERTIKESRLASSYQKNIELIKQEPLQNQKVKFQSLLKLIDLDNKLTSQEKSDIQDEILSALEFIEQKEFKLVQEIISDIETFFLELRNQQGIIEKEDSQQIENDLDASSRIIDSFGSMNQERKKLYSRIATLREQLAEELQKTLELEQLEAESEKQSQEERRKKQEEEHRRLRTLSLEEHEKNRRAYEESIKRGKRLEKEKMTPQSEAQLLKEKKEGKKKEPQSSSSSSAPIMLEQAPTLTIFNNTNTTIAVTYVYASSGRAAQQLITSGQRIDIPIINDFGNHLTSLRYQESSYTNLNPYPYQIDIHKIPQEISSLLTISSGYTSFITSITPNISQYQMIIDGQELNNALRSNKMEQVNRLQTKISSLYNKYEMSPQEQETAVEHYLVKSLILYYYDIAKKLGHTFQEGTFVIYDDSGNIFKFLSSLPGVHKRNSSHFNGVAQTEEDRPWLKQLGMSHFGFDLDLTKEMGKRTILFNKLNKDGTAIYIKPEAFGVQSMSDNVYHTAEFVKSLGRKMVPAYVGSDDAPEYSKERVPQGIRTHFKTLLDKAKEKGLSEELYQSFIRYDDVGGMGIQKMLEIARYLNKEQYAPQEAQEFIQMLNNKHNSNDPKYTHLDKRFGHEVILTDEEFKRFENPLPIK